MSLHDSSPPSSGDENDDSLKADEINRQTVALKKQVRFLECCLQNINNELFDTKEEIAIVLKKKVQLEDIVRKANHENRKKHEAKVLDFTKEITTLESDILQLESEIAKKDECIQTGSELCDVDKKHDKTI